MWGRRAIAAPVFTAVVVLAVGGSSAGSRLDGGAHTFVVSDVGEQSASLAASSARVVARYESFTVVEASGDDADALADAGAELRDDMHELTVDGRSFDPTFERAQLVASDAAPDGSALALVQFVGPVKDGWLELVRETGARVVTYMAQNGYLVHGSAAQLGTLGDLVSDRALRAVVPYTAADKVAAGVEPAGEQRLAVQTLSGADGTEPRRQLASTGTAVGDAAAVGPFRTQFVRVDGAEAVELARDPGVVAVLPDPQPELHDERQAQILAANVTGSDPTGPGYFAFHESLGLGPGTFDFSVDVTDQGLDVGTTTPAHPDLHEGGLLANPSRVAYVHNYTADADGRDCGGHGTLNAGIIGGFNTQTGPTHEDADGFNYDLGIAPRVRVGASKIFGCGGIDDPNFTDVTAAAYIAGARISNNSWGDNQGAGTYDAYSQLYDALVRDAVPPSAPSPIAGNQEMVEVFSAGNGGSAMNTVSAPGTAKNVITVGASEGVRLSGFDDCFIGNSQADDFRDMAGFSGRGPTDDGRTKPDLVAPGTHITGAMSQSPDYDGGDVCEAVFPAFSTLYNLSSGTSHSTPAVSGAAALLRQWYDQTMGPGTQVPSPALTKAILANTSTDLIGGAGAAGNIPNHVQGWGLGNINAALSAEPRFYRDQQDVFGASGQADHRAFSVADPSEPVRITLAWTDPPGPLTGNAFVNDLNLSTTASSKTYKGNVFAAGVSTAGGLADTANNLESIYLPAGSSGRFAVGVTAQNIAGDGVPGNADVTDQDYALVVSNATLVTGPALVHDSTAVTAVLPGDGDGDFEPGERFQIAEKLRNIGTASATAISGTLAGGGPLTFPDPTAAWPNLVIGATANNSDPLSVQLGAGASCGAPLNLTLAITASAGGNTTVPITLATGGAAGPPTVRDSTDVPKTIPNNNPAGVTSTINVAQAGGIKDLDVRIVYLPHGFVGDLRIDLTSPAGTTVNLVNRPGGPDNSGNSFTNTVFDDEAATVIGTGNSPPYTGTFRPQADELSRFDGESRTGTWSLKLTDLAGGGAGDAGTLNDWGHDIRIATCDYVPDTTPPQTTINSGPATGSTTSDPTPRFSFSSNQAGSTFECRVVPAAFGACSGPGATHTTGALADGSWTFAVRATDPSGNADPSPASRAFMVDATPPQTTIDSGPPEGAIITTPITTFGFSSSEAGSTFECKVDAAAFVACSSPLTMAGIPNGAHSFSVRATDPTANVDGSPAVRNFTVNASGGAPPPDTAAPETTITEEPRNETSKKSAVFEFTSSEVGSSFQCKVDKRDFDHCTSPFKVRHLKPGRHSFHVRATDAAGNTDQTPATARWKVRKPPG